MQLPPVGRVARGNNHEFWNRPHHVSIHQGCELSRTVNTSGPPEDREYQDNSLHLKTTPHSTGSPVRSLAVDSKLANAIANPQSAVFLKAAAVELVLYKFYTAGRFLGTPRARAQMGETYEEQIAHDISRAHMHGPKSQVASVACFHCQS